MRPARRTWWTSWASTLWKSARRRCSTSSIRATALQMGVGSGRGGLCVASHDALQSGNRLGAPCSSQLQKLVCLLQNRRKGRGKEVDVFAGFGVICSLLRGMRSASGSMHELVKRKTLALRLPLLCGRISASSSMSYTTSFSLKSPYSRGIMWMCTSGIVCPAGGPSWIATVTEFTW